MKPFSQKTQGLENVLGKPQKPKTVRGPPAPVLPAGQPATVSPSVFSVHNSSGTMRALKWAAGIALGIDPEESVNRDHSTRSSRDARSSIESGYVLQ